MSFKQVNRVQFINAKNNDLSPYYNTQKEASLFGDDYYLLLHKKFDAFKYYMQKRNDDLQAKISKRQLSSPSKNPISGLIKENQNEIAELS